LLNFIEAGIHCSDKMRTERLERITFLICITDEDDEQVVVILFALFV